MNRIILRHKGKLILSNREGGGLMVRMTLPLRARPTRRTSNQLKTQTV